MKQVLTGLPHLEHLDFNPHWCERRDRMNMWGVNFTPSNILPDALMPQLKTFALRNVVLEVPLLRILITGMRNAESITFDHVTFRNHSSSRALFTDCEDAFHLLRSHYAQSMTDVRPKFTWMEPFGDGNGNHRRCYLLDDEIDAFLYNGAKCPFDGEQWSNMAEGAGWIIDERDKSFRMRPTGHEWLSG